MTEWDYNMEHQSSDISCHVKEGDIKSSVVEVEILGHKVTSLIDCGAEVSLCCMHVWKQISRLVSHPTLMSDKHVILRLYRKTQKNVF